MTMTSRLRAFVAPRRSSARIGRWALTGLALWAATAAMAHTRGGSGVGELSLDRAALMAVISGALPRSAPIELPGLEPVELTVAAIESLRFVEGEVEARVSVTLDTFRVTGVVLVRYAPAVDRVTGTARLEARSAGTVAPLRVDFDLAEFLPPIELPRRWDWSMPLDDGRNLDLVVFVQGLEVEEERLRLELGLAARGSGNEVVGYR